MVKNLDSLSRYMVLYCDSKDNIYAVDTRNARIQKFTPDGEFITSWGKNGVNNGEFMIIHDIDVDSNDNLYVVDMRDSHPTKMIVKKFTEMYQKK